MKTPTLKTLPAHLVARVVTAPARSTRQACAVPNDRPAAGVTISEPERSARSGQIPKATPEQQRPARLRPVCHTARWPGFEGYRVVMHGLSPEQHRVVTEAAAGAGVTVVPAGS